MYDSQVCIIPDEVYRQKFFDLIRFATSRIVLVSFLFSSSASLNNQLYNSLESVVIGGVKVDIFYNLRFSSLRTRQQQLKFINSLSVAGCRCHQYAGCGCEHRKILIVDDSLALIGSHNLTEYSFSRNKELSLLVRSSSVVSDIDNILIHDYQGYKL